MKSVGLITEYNPFHNGHAYHAQQAKVQSDAEISIAIMSGNFVMRGEPAIYNKFLRTQMALSNVDLVVELPLIASLSSSDYFAQIAVQVARYLDVNTIAFGSETPDITRLKNVANEIINLEHSSTFNQKVKEGSNYAKIINDLISDNTLLKMPNNILAITYLKAIQQFAPHMKGLAIQRVHAHHHDATIETSSFASGSAIRQSLITQETQWTTVVPSSIQSLYTTPHLTKEDTFSLIKYHILSHSIHEMAHIYTISEGLEHRLKKYINQATSFESFMSLLKTKRFTYTHLQRILMQILLNVKKEDSIQSISAVRILGMNRRGQSYLKQLKTKFPERQFITNINKTSAHFFKNEIKSTDIYNLLSGQQKNDFNTPVIRLHN